MTTQKRKGDHISVCLKEDVEYLKGNGFHRYEFEHNALPGLDLDSIDTTASFLGRNFRAPLFIEAMTGGTREAARINRNLAAAAQELGIGMGVGSQRAMLEDQGLSWTYEVKESFPDVFLMGNIGASHIMEFDLERIKSALRRIKADALAIHINAAQEMAQPGGYTEWKNVLPALKKVCSGLGMPVIVKEVGNGISGQVARKLASAGVDAIDVAGAGGTSWVKVDTIIGGRPFQNFFEWGIPTAECLVDCRRAVRTPLIASGGIRTGIEVAKAVSLGASLAGLALPLLKPATQSAAAVKSVLEKIMLELRGCMFLTGSATLAELRGKMRKI